MKISIGCGARQKPGWEGLDIVDFGWNHVCNIGTDKFPFEDNSADFIECHNTMEHIDRREWKNMLNECWRVLKQDGVLEIITPDFDKSPALALQDPTHIAFVVKGTFTQYFTGARPRNASYGFKPWKIIKCENYEAVEPRDIFCQMTPNK